MSVQAHAQLPVLLQGQSQAETLRDYLGIARRRRWVILLAIAVTLIAVILTSSNAPLLYRASTTVMPDKSPPVALADARSSFFAEQAIAQAPNWPALIELATSGQVLGAALKRLSSSVGEDAARTALAAIDAQNVRYTDLVRISVNHANPEVAAAAANAIAQSMLEANLAARRAQVTETRRFINDQLILAERALRESEEALIVFRKQQGNITLPEDTVTTRKIAELSAHRVDVLLERRETQAKVEAARARLASQARISPTQWTPSPVIVNLQSQLASLEIELSGLRRQFTPIHPSIISAQAKVEETKRRLATEVAREPQPGAFGVDPMYQQLFQQVRQGELALAALDARGRALNSAIDQYTQKAESLPERETQLVRLTRAAKSTEQTFLLLGQRLQEARIAEASIGNGIQVLAAAAVPLQPITPRRYRSAILGTVLGLMVGIVAALVMEHLDEGVKSAEEVERILGVPVLGSIPIIRRRRAPAGETKDHGPMSVMGELPVGWAPVMQSYDESLASEAFRILRTQLLYAMPEPSRKCLLVTSALPGEGKSTVVTNLATAFARTGRKVWVIETDLRRPGLDRVYPEAVSNGGLAGFLAEQAQLSESVRPTREPNLWYVAGGTAPNPPELLASQRMSRFIAEGRVLADVVLLDSPPLLPLSDTSAVGRNADGAVLVVHVGQTNRRALAHTRRRLEQAGVPLMCAVLNFVPSDSRDSYHSAYQAYMTPHLRTHV